MLRETDPNLPHTKRLSGIGVPEVGFALGAALATVGLALVFLPYALFALGALLMVVTWRAA